VAQKFGKIEKFPLLKHKVSRMSLVRAMYHGIVEVRRCAQ